MPVGRTTLSRHPERHLSHRGGWLRAVVLGANDGIVSTAGIVVGVAAASASTGEVITAGIAGLVAGALSMAAGEYVSVSSQRDVEQADLSRERAELAADPEAELRELASIYEARGLRPELAGEVAAALSVHDALGAHARDELGIGEATMARPLQAAGASGLAFSVGAALPLLAAALTTSGTRIAVTFAVTMVALALTGDLAARLGGADRVRATLRVVLWGAVAMVATIGIGSLVGAAT